MEMTKERNPMMHLTRFLDRRAAAVAVAVVIGLGLSSCGFANTSSAGPSDPFTAGLFNALNNDRVANGRPPLTWSPKLANQAGSWAVQMSNDNSLHHQNLSALLYSPDYAAYRTLGENILVGPGEMTPQRMESAWMASPSHRANIANGAFNIVGIGYRRGPDGRLWAAQEFGGI
jgi:uncharacterized protein YkwD